jgi:diguanylate cyclase (GGDEF)-like protein
VAVYVDLDHFKRTIEFLDPAAIASLLCKAAQRLRQIARPEDLLARIVDDEFAVLVAGPDAPAAAGALAERAVEIMSRPFLVGGQQLTLGASVGLAAPSEPGEAFEQTLRHALIGMQHGRRIGHGRLQWFDASMVEAVRERQFIEVGLRRALVLGELEVFYQPQFSFAEGAITGFEALARWRHPERGLISPGVFIPVAEEAGLMVPLGSWVLREACRAAAAWSEPLTIAVNVSPLQFETDAFLDVLRAALEESGLPPQRLELEMTEAMLLSGSSDTVGRMQAVRETGVRLALDDFGTGYSSLNYLRQFPFDKIKMDQSFVRGPNADKAGYRIVAAVAELGGAFGMSVLAEGVETNEQLEGMRRRGCSAVQGYLFSSPIPGPAVEDYLARFRASAAATTGEGA